MSRSFREGFQPIKSKANDPRRAYQHDDMFATSGKRGGDKDAKREARRQEKRNQTHFYSL
jgi:hypothetical protein